MCIRDRSDAPGLTGKAKFKATMAKRKAIEGKEIINNSTLVAVTPTEIYSEYFDWNDMQQKIFTKTTAARWAKELVEFARVPGTIKVTDYFIQNGIFYETAMQLCEKYEILDQAYKHARYIVGSTRRCV